ncbi:TIGR02444 family protein [Rhodoplanes sp. SY1]|uniref:TIGR02444 family protein n=1 Tax=Rhodoplanes sp. SY1 TaxID=3166646 RepID=UPI0038B52A5E
MDAPEENGSPFWRFSLATYRKPGVAEACLALQDGHGVDVNVLLFAMWLGTQGRRLDAAEMRRVLDAAAGWARDVVVPLRLVRRRLKDAPPLVEPATAQAFRSEVKRLELEAERLEQEALFGLAAMLPASDGTPPTAAVRANIETLAQAMGTAFPAAAVERLAGAVMQL